MNHTQVQEYVPLTRSVVDVLLEPDEDVDVLVFRLADFLNETGNFSEASTLFNRAATGFADSGNAVNLSVCWERLGDLHQAQGQFDKALGYFEKRAQLGEELFKANPHSEQLKNGLAISYSKLGALHQEQGQFDKALGYFEKDLQLTEELYKANPQSVGLFNSLAVSYWKLGSLAHEMGKNSQARPYFEQAEVIWTVLCEQVGIPEYCNNLALARRVLAGLE